MRTTINLDEEATEIVAALRRETGVGMSEAVNTLVRRSAGAPRVDYAFPRVTFEMGARIPLDRVGDVLDQLDEVDGRR